MTPTTEEQLSALEKLTAEATPVAWMYEHEGITGKLHRVVCPMLDRMEHPESRGWAETPLYSASAPEAISRAIAMVRELQAEVARKDEALAEVRDWIDADDAVEAYKVIEAALANNKENPQ